jgi:two-component system chemotaxis response regulator CheY
MAPTRSARSFCVLLVDGDGDTREKCAVALTAAGFVVIHAGDGAVALRCASKSRPDVIVTDVQLPRMDGVTLISCLQGDVRTAGIPVIVVTASGDVPARVRTGPAAAFLPKPCPPDVLVTEVSRLIDVAHPSYPLAAAGLMEHTRLQACTVRLRQKHATLHRDRTPFDVLDHHEHLDALRKHRAALLTHKHRLRITRPIRLGTRQPSAARTI